MRRYYIDDEVMGDEVQLSPEDSHHALRVLRQDLGEVIEVVTPSGQLYSAEILAFEPVLQARVLEKLDKNSELPIRVTLACGLSKGDKLETIAQKTTETGVHEIIPLELKRDVTRWKGSKADKKVDRLNRIAEEASKQSKRLRVPKVHPLHDLEDLVQLAGGFDYLLVADEDLGHGNQHGGLKSHLEDLRAGQSILAVFGSEGGFDRDEIDLLKTNGFKPISLGPRILRAETAPVYLMSVLSYLTEL